MQIVSRKILLDGLGEKHKFKVFSQGDQHNDDPGYIPRSTETFIRAVDEAPPNSGALLLGDLSTFANTRSMRVIKKMRAEATSDVSESLDAWVWGSNIPFLKKLKPLAKKDRIWGIVEGNHTFVFDEDGSTIDTRFADALGCPYSDGILILCLSISTKTRHNASRVNIVAHHGTSGAQTKGGDINALVKRSDYYSNAHIYLSGHTHDLSVNHIDRLIITDTSPARLKHAVFWVARTGGAVQAYSPGKASYPEKRAMKPTTPGHVEFDIWLERYQRDNMGGKDLQEVKIFGRSIPMQGSA